MSKTKILVVGTPLQYENLIQQLPQQHDFTVGFQERIAFNVLSLITAASRYELVVYFAGAKMDIGVLITEDVFHNMSSPVIFIKDNLTINQTVDLMNAGAKGVVPPTDTDRLITLINRTVEVVSSQSPDSLYKDIVDCQAEFICRYDADLRIQYANRAYCDWQGLSLDELVGTSIIEKIPPEDRDKAIEHVQSLTSEQPVATSIHNTILPDRSVQTIEWTDRAVFDADGNIIEYQGVGRDVTAREKQAQELQSYRVHMNAVLSTMQDALMTMSLPERETIFVSHAFESVFGYPHKNFIDDPKFFMQVVHPDDLETAIEAQQTCLREGFAEFDHRIIWPDGQVRWLHRRAWINYDENGQPVRVNDSARDITDRIETERSLAASEELHRAILSTISDAVFITDDEGKFTFICPNTQIIFGYSHDEAVSMETIQKLTGRIAFDLSQLKQDKEIANIEHRVADKWGTHHDLLINVKEISIGDGTILYSCRDVTERKQAEDKMLAQNEFLHQSRDLIAMADSNGIITYMNQGGANLLGVTSPEDLIGISLTTTHPVEEATKTINEYVPQALETGYWRGENRLKTFDGRVIDVDQTLFPIYDKNGNLISAATIIVDITERKKAEVALQESEALYRSLSESSDDAILVISANGDFKFANTIAAGQLSLIPDTMIGKNLNDVFPFKDAEQRLSTIRGVIDTGEGVVFESQSAITGELRWYRTSIQPINRPTGEIDSVLLRASDITVFKEAEASLLEGEKRYRQMFESVSLPKLITDPQTAHILDANPAAIAFYGYPLETLKTMTMLQLNVAEPDVVMEKMQEVLAGERDLCQFEQRLADGTTREVEGYPSVIKYESQDALYCTYIDVTERNRARAALEDINHLLEQQVKERTQALTLSRNRIEAIFNHSADAIMLLDAEMKIEQANYAFDEMFATMPDTYFGKSLLDLIDENHRISVAKQLPVIVQSYETQRIELEFLRIDGTLFEGEISIAPVSQSDKAVGNVVCIIRDISERRRAQRKIAEERNLLRTLIDAIPNYIYVKNTNHEIILNNTAHAQFIGGLVNEQSQKDDYLKEIHPDLRDKIKRTEKQILESGQPIENIEDQVVRRDGLSRWTTTTKVPLRDLQGEIIGLVGITTDITHLKQQESLIRESEERYRLTIASLSEGLVVQNSNGEIEVCNEAAETILGLTSEQMMGRTSIDPRWRAIHEDGSPFPGEDHPAMVTLQTGEPQSNVIMGVHKPDDSTAWILVNSRVLVTTGEERSVVATFADITEQRQAQHAVAEERNMLRTVIDAVPDFIYVKDTDHRMILNNDAHARSMGFTPVDVVGKTDFELFPSKLAVKFHADEAKLFETETALINVEERSLGVDGTEIWALTTKVPLRNLQGKLTGLVGITRDVTELKSKEDALRHSERRLQESEHMLQLVLDTIPVRVFWKDTNLNYLGCNRHFAKDAGLTDTGTIVGKSDLEMPWAETQAEAYRTDDKTVIDSGIPKLNFEEVQINAMGQSVILETSKIPLRDTNNQIIGMLGTYIDITDRKQAEDTLKSVMQRLKLATEAGGIGIWDWYTETGEMLWDEQMYNIYGIDDRHFTGSVEIWNTSLHPEDAARAQADVEAALQGKKRFDTEFRIKTPNGNIRYIRAHANTYRREDDTPYRMIGVNIDITEQKIAELALRASEERFRLFVEATPIATLICNSNKQIVLANQATQHLFGYRHEELVGQSIQLLVPDVLRDRHTLHMNGFIHGDSDHRTKVEVSGRHKNGTEFFADIQLQRLQINSEMFVMVLVLDVSERLKAEESLRISLERERELARLRSRFVSTASHQFRTPLAAILASTETLTKLRDKLKDEQIDERLDRIQSQVMRMKHLMEDVLELSRLQSNQIRYNPEMSDLSALCREVIDDFAHQMEYKDRIIQSGLQTSLVAMLDPHLMHHVVSNLIHNALKYSDDEVYVDLLQLDHEIIFEVRDQGIGVSEADIKSLFMPFSRAENVGTIEGTGLGLSIAKQAVDVHRGTIDVKSTVGEGTTFTVRIPYRSEGDGNNG